MLNSDFFGKFALQAIIRAQSNFLSMNTKKKI